MYNLIRASFAYYSYIVLVRHHFAAFIIRLNIAPAPITWHTVTE
jgi:hypothetical protein